MPKKRSNESIAESFCSARLACSECFFQKKTTKKQTIHIVSPSPNQKQEIILPQTDANIKRGINTKINIRITTIYLLCNVPTYKQ